MNEFVAEHVESRITFLMVNPNEKSKQPNVRGSGSHCEVTNYMPLPIKCTTEIIMNRVSDRIRGTPFRKRPVRFKEHSRPRVSCTSVHIVPKLVEPIDTAYPHFISNNVADEGNKKKIERHPKKYELLLMQ